MPRTRGASKISDVVRNIIENEALANLAEPRAEVVARLQSLIRKKGKRIPEEETLAKMVSGARRPTRLDDPWSLGVNLPEIPPEATGDLLAVWRQSLKVGRRLTIRQARWVARLRSALPGVSKPRLLWWATLYERRERGTEARRKLMDTTDLDGELAFLGRWSTFNEMEYDTAVMTGNVPLSEGHWPPRYIDAAPPDVLKQGELSPERVPKASSLGPYSFYLNQARLFLEQVGGMAITLRSWWEQSESIMVFWLREISSKVKKWHDIELICGGALPGDKEREEWETMGRRLATLVITQAKALEQHDAKAKEIGECIDMLRSLEEQRRIALADKEARRWVPWVEAGKGYILISPEVQELDAQIDEVSKRLSNLPKGYYEAWKPTELLKEVGYEE